MKNFQKREKKKKSLKKLLNKYLKNLEKGKKQLIQVDFTENINVKFIGKDAESIAGKVKYSDKLIEIPDFKNLFKIIEYLELKEILKIK